MPKAKKQGGSTLFSVSPWQDRQEDGYALQPAQPAAEAGYVEVELPLVVAASPPASGGGGNRLAAAPGLPPAGTPDAMALDTAPPAATAARQAGVPGQATPGPIAPALAAAVASQAAGGGGGWIAKKRRAQQEEEEGEMIAAAAAAADSDSDLSACPLGGGGASAGSDEAGGRQQQGQVELAGTAYLALLPNGSVTGHLVCAPSAFAPARRRSFGVMGEVAVAGRECTRDADWGVLRMTLVSFAGGGGGGAAGGGEVSFLAERTEGDAMRLRAPVPWQGIELDDLPALDAACTCAAASGLSLRFHCQQLLSGAAADALLRSLQPSLAGRGAMLNVGLMRVALPRGAAAALMPAAEAAGRAAVGTGAGGRGGRVEAPSGAARGQEPMQRRYTGRSSGGGRAVQDAGDEW